MLRPSRIASELLLRAASFASVIARPPVVWRESSAGQFSRYVDLIARFVAISEMMVESGSKTQTFGIL
eukprot:11165170-Lingulodinium_polyedra.AAC.1